MDTRHVVSGSPRLAEGAQVARSPWSRLACRAALAVVAFATLALAAPASATEITFASAGEHSFPVPNGVSSLGVVATGAQGEAGSAAAGGPGATVSATLPVTPGDTSTSRSVSGAAPVVMMAAAAHPTFAPVRWQTPAAS